MFGHQFPSWVLLKPPAKKPSLISLLSDKVDFFVNEALKGQGAHPSISEPDPRKDLLKKEFLKIVTELDNKIAKKEITVPQDLYHTIRSHLACVVKEQKEIDTLSPKTTPGRV